MDGVLYCNDGDWVDSCSALIENRNGELELWLWTDADGALSQVPRARSLTAPPKLCRLAPARQSTAPQRPEKEYQECQ